MRRPVLILFLLIGTMAVSFLLPKPKYAGLNILTQLKIPAQFPGWVSVDVSKRLNLQDARYNFISDVFARIYQNSHGDELLFLVLDAGNFHDPKVCYTAAGFSTRELDEVSFKTKDKAFKVTALDTRFKGRGTYLFYWLCIDKKTVGWADQKMIELWYSMFNKKKAGLMVRIEIPTEGRSSQQAIALGRDFINTLSYSLDTEQKEYLFGK